MKRKLIITILAVITLITLTGCKHTRNVVKDNPMTSRVIMEEWISPDGVHYWFGVYPGCLAPRYDHDGNLIID